MDAVEALTRLGGIARARDIVGLSSRGSLRRAVRAGDVVRVGPGRDAFAVSHAEAQALDGVVFHRSAALHWGWEVTWPPDRPWVTVARSRHITAARRRAVHLVYADVDDVIGGVTSPLRTVIDCARRLSFDEALAVADSALRDGRVTEADLVREAAGVRGRGAAQCRRVAGAATCEGGQPARVGAAGHRPRLPARPRATGAGVDRWADLRPRPGRCEPASGSRSGFVAVPRQSARARSRLPPLQALVLGGWLVLRFTWDQVMHSPDYVRDVLAGLARRGAESRAG